MSNGVSGIKVILGENSNFLGFHKNCLVCEVLG
jgi:hypothetical protein